MIRNYLYYKLMMTTTLNFFLSYILLLTSGQFDKSLINTNRLPCSNDSSTITITFGNIS